ncbi:MAG: tRNA lysidine(34) synthetase TilS [Dehalococcoidia bacterium]|nr:tRNA lysidine(34) synthetase TilS [Dehalococcoidia bacterium]
MKKPELEPRIEDFIWRHKLISTGDIIGVAVSGGADSVCLLHILAKWRSKLNVKLHVAHLNHQLRGAESEADAKYVVDLAARLDVPCTIGRRDVMAYKAEKSCSTEEAARDMRYDFLAEVAAVIGASRMAIGHTRDDQVETILMHILRGTGVSGLRGLEPCSPIPCQNYQTLATSRPTLAIKPLLDVTRQETMRYCQEYHLEPRSDSSNFSLAFRRNRLRLELLPLLREYNSNVDQALLRLAGIANDDVVFIEQQALGLWDEMARGEEDVVYLNKRKSIALPLALQRQLIRLALVRVLGSTKDVEAIHIEAIRGLLSKPVGKRISLPHNIICYGGYNEIAIAAKLSHELFTFCHFEEVSRLKGVVQDGISEKFKQNYFSQQPVPLMQGRFRLHIPGETILPGWRVIASISSAVANAVREPQSNLVATLDLQEVGNELSVRQCQPGDSFRPLGMRALKKLRRFMSDAKIPLPWRDYVPLVCSPRQIVWVVGWRIDDRVKITGTGRETLRLEFIKLI